MSNSTVLNKTTDGMFWDLPVQNKPPFVPNGKITFTTVGNKIIGNYERGRFFGVLVKLCDREFVTGTYTSDAGTTGPMCFSGCDANGNYVHITAATNFDGSYVEYGSPIGERKFTSV